MRVEPQRTYCVAERASAPPAAERVTNTDRACACLSGQQFCPVHGYVGFYCSPCERFQPCERCRP